MKETYFPSCEEGRQGGGEGRGTEEGTGGEDTAYDPTNRTSIHITNNPLTGRA
jgi:hypothetical protein